MDEDSLKTLAIFAAAAVILVVVFGTLPACLKVLAAVAFIFIVYKLLY